MSDDVVVVDNGLTYETQESAIVAKKEADRAEQWAKYSEEKANLAGERAVDAAESSDAAAQAATAAIEAKQYAETAITDENLIVVATDLKSTSSNIKKTAGSIDNVNTVGENIDNVNLLAPHTEAMETLAPDIMDVVTVAGIAKQTKNVSENMTAVVDVSKNKTNIDNVSTNIAAVNNVSENMADVKAAVQSANDAKLWAVGTITEKPEGSSKYWAEQAQQAAQVYDASETVKGIVRLSTSEEAKAGLDDKTAITPLKLKQNIVDNVGRINQLGFNGVLQSGVITFTPDQGTYELKAGYEYEIDLLFSAVGIIPDDTQLKIVNGTDTINIVNVLDSDYSKPTTYKAMKQVCRYDTEIGWRWIFNVRYSVASDGSKVFVMPATATNVDTTDVYNKIDTKQDKSTAINYNNISNCITYIPQDIKLELNNGTLTLKAGSKVYIPNGFETSVEPLYAWPVSDNEIYYTESETPAVGDKTFNEKGIYTYYKVNKVSGTTLVLQKGSGQVIEQVTVTRDTSKDTYFSKPDTTKPKFDVVTIESDKVWSSRNLDYPQQFIFFKPSQAFEAVGESSGTIHSGATAPSGKQYMLWYDTTNNFIKWTSDSGSTWVSGNSFPLSICSSTQANNWTSIDQVFNGFGYIGSTVYALPGVKGLYPNGRNTTNGSLKSIEFTLDKVLIATRTTSVNNQINQHISLGLNYFYFSAGYVESVDMPSVNAYLMWYNPRDNVMRYNSTGNNVTSIADYPIVKWIDLGGTGAGDGTSKITSFTPKTVFHALDYNDKSTISGWSMPGDKYINLTLGANGSNYTAPANGYLCLCKDFSAGNQYILFRFNTGNVISEITFWGGTGVGYIAAMVPVKKGRTIAIGYTASGETRAFRFVFAEGETYNPVSSVLKDHSYTITDIPTAGQDDMGDAG